MTDEFSIGDVELHPAWRQAVREFIAADHKPGDRLERVYFYGLLRVAMPAPDTPMAAAEKARLAFLQQFTAFRDELLTEHQIDLEAVPGFGYRVVPPAEQTALAERQGRDEVRRALRKSIIRLANVDLAALDHNQRRDNADAMARMSQLRGLVRTIAAPER